MPTRQTIYDVPLYSQSWDLDGWRKLGFKNREDAEYWERSSCGILCINEVASFLNQTKYSTAELIDKGLNLDGYTDKHGWGHDGLVRLAESLGLQAQAGTYSVEDLRNLLDQKRLAIASIKWAFEPHKTTKERLFFWKKYGGHLAVVVGYQEQNGQLEGFYINHTSIRSRYNWKSRFIPLDKFRQGYTGRAIIIWK